MAPEQQPDQGANSVPDRGNDPAQGQPPEPMRELRIMSMPDGRSRYVPPEGASDRDLALVQYHVFMEVVRELASSQMRPIQMLGAKLESAVVQNGHDVIAQMVSQAQANQQYVDTI